MPNLSLVPFSSQISSETLRWRVCMEADRWRLSVLFWSSFSTSIVFWGPEEPDFTTAHRLTIQGDWSCERKRERENKHCLKKKKTLFMNSPKTWKANTASWLVVVRRHVDNEDGLALSPSLHCPACWVLSYSCHGKRCHSTPHLLLQ